MPTNPPPIFLPHPAAPKILYPQFSFCAPTLAIHPPKSSTITQYALSSILTNFLFPNIQISSVVTNFLFSYGQPRALYERLKGNSGNQGGFDFMCPSSLSIAGNSDAMRTRTEMAKLLANRLETVKNENLIIVPCNPGFHWVLVAIDMKTLTVYYLDSLRRDIGEDLKEVVQKDRFNRAPLNVGITSWDT